MEQADLIAWQRSVAMLTPNAAVSLERERLLEILDELVATRALLARLGADLKTVARRAP
jgi:hypothetical protein